jgi:hypothetical protein
LVEKTTNQIADRPFLFKKTDFKDIRMASLSNYSIYYKITDREIIITAFWDNRQDPKKLLQALQNRDR